MVSSRTSIGTCVVVSCDGHNFFVSSFLQVNDSPAHEHTIGPEIVEDVIATLPTPSRPLSGKVLGPAELSSA